MNCVSAVRFHACCGSGQGDVLPRKTVRAVVMETVVRQTQTHIVDGKKEAIALLTCFFNLKVNKSEFHSGLSFTQAKAEAQKR